MNNDEHGNTNKRQHKMNPNTDISVWERHGQSILAGLILGGVIYIATQSVEATKNIEVLNVKVEALSKTLDIAASERYKAGDARRDFELRDERINANTKEIEHLKQYHR
jgi:outer membrane murein-binding lipoprotein Lpp